jgi:hypothetical protein
MARPVQFRDVARSPTKTVQEELSGVDEARRPQVERIAKSCIKSLLRQYFRAIRGESSPRGAIKIMCLHCVGWEKSEAYGCTARGCPLWAYRPQPRTAGEGIGETDNGEEDSDEAGADGQRGATDYRG